MPIAWIESSSQRLVRPPILKIVQPVRVCFLADTKATIKVFLHWRDRDSVPCQGTDCQHCHLPVREYAYAPVAYAAYQETDQRWQWARGILPIPSSQMEIAWRDYCGQHFKVYRQGHVKTGRMVFERTTGPKIHDAQAWDIRPALLALWGTRVKLTPVAPPDQADVNQADVNQADVGLDQTEGGWA